jgi:hypothetical protein
MTIIFSIGDFVYQYHSYFEPIPILQDSNRNSLTKFTEWAYRVSSPSATGPRAAAKIQYLRRITVLRTCAASHDTPVSGALHFTAVLDFALYNWRNGGRGDPGLHNGWLCSGIDSAALRTVTLSLKDLNCQSFICKTETHHQIISRTLLLMYPMFCS